MTLDQKPVAGASVLFLPVRKGMAASAETDATGRFAMQTANRIGAGVGEYTVSINKSTTVVKNVPGAMMPLYERKYELPAAYASPETSGLTASVTADEDRNQFTFDLKSK